MWAQPRTRACARALFPENERRGFSSLALGALSSIAGEVPIHVSIFRAPRLASHATPTVARRAAPAPRLRCALRAQSVARRPIFVRGREAPQPAQRVRARAAAGRVRVRGGSKRLGLDLACMPPVAEAAGRAQVFAGAHAAARDAGDERARAQRLRDGEAHIRAFAARRSVDEDEQVSSDLGSASKA